MPANRFNGFTDYGVGIGLRVPHYDHIFAEKPSSTGSRSSPRTTWSTAAAHSKCSTRSSNSIASCSTAYPCTSAPPSQLNREHLKRLKDLTRRTKTPWLSDHLCWGSVDGTLHARPAAHAVHVRSRARPRPHAFAKSRTSSKSRSPSRTSAATPSFTISEMTEWEFLNEVVEAGRLRHSARREQHLRLVSESQLRPLRLREQRPRRARRADPHRRPLEVREIHPRHARSSRTRSGLESLRPRHRTLSAPPQRCSNGTTTSRRSTRFTPKPSKQRNISRRHNRSFHRSEQQKQTSER